MQPPIWLSWETSSANWSSFARDIQELGRTRAKAAASERELRSRIQKLPAKAPDAARLQAELDETRQVVKALAEQEQDSRARQRQLHASPEHQTITAISSDKRRPSKADISGVWTSGLNLTGYTIQLDQRGQSVRGKGFYWGCLGTYDVFGITGSYQNDVLSLSFDVARPKQPKHVFHYCEERHRPRFQVPNSTFNERIIPSNELR